MQPLPDRPGDHRLVWSQLNGLGENAVILWLEGAPRDDLDSDAQQFSQILEQADMINKGGTRLEIHEQVQIAVRASLSPGDGAEYRNPVHPALPPRALGFVEEWARLRHAEILANWERARKNEPLLAIQPLP